jgi:hypothetical protein
MFVERKGEAMDPKNKFAAETVWQLQQSLDAVAPYQETELSKQQAIRTLSPQIFALRSKGYSWTAVATMLSEHGVPVSVAALRTYLRRVREEVANETPRTQPKTFARRPRRHAPAGATARDRALAGADRRDAVGKEAATTRSSRRVGRRSAARDGSRDPA